MKKIKFMIFLLLNFIAVDRSFADHIYGGEITYKFVSALGNKQTYRVTLSIFGDCAASITSSAFLSLTGASPGMILYKGNNAIMPFDLEYQPLQSDIEITPVCPDEVPNTACKDMYNLIPGIKLFVYSADVEIVGTDTNWRFAFQAQLPPGSIAGRSFNIQNVSAPAGYTLMYLEATLNNTAGTNSSVTFTSLPTPFFCKNKTATYSLGAADVENDQLKFSLLPAKSVNEMPPPIFTDIIYIPPFSATAPLPTVTGNFNFNTISGQMNFTPNEIKNCLVTNLVEEYRDGVKVGSTMREMTFVILDNCNNDAPSTSVSHIQNSDIISDDANGLQLSVCEGQTTDISFDIYALDPNGDNINISYSNVPQGGSVTIANNGTDSAALHFAWNAYEATPGNYIFYITYTDDGCPLVVTKTIAYTITVVPHPYVLESGSISTCAGMSTGKAWVVPGPGVNFDYHYRWTNALGETLRETNSTQGDTLINIPPGTYKVYVRNAEGCGKNILISVDELPLPELTLPNDTTLCAGLPVELTTTPQNNMHYLWNTGDTTCCITATTTGQYTLTVSNLCGNISKSVTLDFVKCNYCFFVPNAFSPNNDGHNDKFNILETCLIEKYQLQIFNRWGELLFTTLSTAKSWDGTYNGRDAASGVYYYRIIAIPVDRSKGTVELRGDITLIR